MIRPALDRLLGTLALGAAAAAFGCAAPTAPPDAALLELLAAAEPQAAPFRETARVRLTTPQWRGDFTAVLVAAPGSRPRARIQLFPDLGGKFLDLAASPERITGWMPQAQQRFDARFEPAGGGAKPDSGLLFFMGVTLLERFAPLAGRVVAVRSEGEGTLLRLRPVIEGVSAHALVDAAGRVLERRFAYGFARWSEREAPGGAQIEIEGEDFDMRVERGARVTLDEVPPEVFELHLPGGAR